MEPQPQVTSIALSALPQLNSESSQSTCVALVINLTVPLEEQMVAGAQFLAPLLERLGLPATWVIDQPRQAKVLARLQLLTTGHELALSVSARSPQRLQSDLANLQAEVLAVSGHEVSVVAGDPQELRSRAALLADLGIGAVVSGSQPSGPAKPPRLLPCGLWQFDSALNIPQPCHRWSWLTMRRPTLRHLMGSETSGKQKVVAIDLGKANSRELQGCGQLLQEIADASRQRQLNVATVSTLAALQRSKRKVKPQRSILRRAA